METINRELVKNLRGHIQKAIDDYFGGRTGSLNPYSLPNLKIEVGNASFTESNVTFKVEVALVGKGGEIKTKEAESFKAFASLYGMKAEDFGKSFTTGGHTYKIVGLKTSRHKLPVVVEREDGRKFKFGADHTKMFLSK